MRPTALVVMGVAGCGKSTVAGYLADRLGWPLGEADDWHPPANVAAMTAGTPLTDADRAPWLLAALEPLQADEDGVVVGISGTPAEVADRVVAAAARQVSGSGNSWQVVG